MCSAVTGQDVDAVGQSRGPSPVLRRQVVAPLTAGAVALVTDDLVGNTVERPGGLNGNLSPWRKDGHGLSLQPRLGGFDSQGREVRGTERRSSAVAEPELDRDHAPELLQG